MTPFVQADNGVTFLRSSLLEAPRWRHGFSTRLGGVSAGPYATLNLGFGLGDTPDHVTTNLDRFLTAVAPERPRLACVTQVHGSRIVQVDQKPSRPFPTLEADGLITGVPGWLVGVRTADCVPILMASPRAVAAIHAGWRGTVAGIAEAAVQAFQTRYQVSPSELRVAIGPAIGVECYDVGIEVAEAIAAILADGPEGSTGVVLKTREEGRERFRVDLREANRRLLVRAGVPSAAIDVLPMCVACREDLFFSHRRDRGTTGRMLNVIGLTEPSPGRVTG